MGKSAINVFNFVHLAQKLTLPCEKSYFSSLQQQYNVRNVKAATENVSKVGFTDEKDLHRYSPTNM